MIKAMISRLALALSAVAVLLMPGKLEAGDFMPGMRYQEEDTPPPKYDEARYRQSPDPGIPLREPDMEWINDAIESMSLDEKIGQMLMTGQGPGRTTSDVIDEITNNHVGGVVFFGNGRSAADIVSVVNTLQNASPFPLWFSIDAEAGVGARLADATIFPLIMAQGAAADPALAEACGRITAREAQALGIQAVLGPVIDVNTEPVNPIISTRAPSDMPGRVVNVAEPFVLGARAEGALCTLKHYPGHGATQGDSHSSLPGVSLPIEEIRRTHIWPYGQLIEDDSIDIVMTAHVWYSDVYPDMPWPATLSYFFNTEILRDELGFEGILISDSYNMSGLTIAVPDAGERAVVGIESGLDVILDTGSMSSYFSGIKAAVNSGRLTEGRIDESVRRVLIAKSRAGLPERATVPTDGWQGVVGHPEHRDVVRQVSEKAFTRFKDTTGDTPPVSRTENVYVLSLSASQTIFYRFGSSLFTDPFGAEVPNTTLESVSRNLSQGTISGIVANAANFDKVLVLGYDWYHINSSSQIQLINALAAADTPVIYVGFGAPYHILDIPNVDGFYCGYSSVQQMQEAAVKILLGDLPEKGNPPVILEGLEQPAIGDSFLLN